MTSLWGAEEIRIGGSELLLAFFDEAFRLRVEHMVVLTPYVDDGAFADSMLRNAWERALTIADNTIVVRTASAAEVVLRATQTRHRRCDVRVSPNLHAKAFVAWRPGAETALIGSHNLTGAALHTNKEIGMLIKPASNAMREIVWKLQITIRAVVRTSSPYRMNPHPSLKGHRSRSNGAPQNFQNTVERLSPRDLIA